MRLMIVLLASICSLSGCSLTGYLVGSGIDRKAPDFDTLKTYSRLDPGDDITIIKKDGSAAIGTVVEPLPSLSFDQKVAKITGPSSPTFNLTTGSFSNAMSRTQSVPTHIVVRDFEKGEVRVSMDSIQCIIAPHGKHASFTGLILGAAVDVAVVAFIASVPKMDGFPFGSGKW